MKILTLKICRATWRWMRRLVRRVFCRHSLAWVRNIHGDEINATGCRTVWRCDKCGKHIYDPQYFTREMAIKHYDPTNANVEARDQ